MISEEDVARESSLQKARRKSSGLATMKEAQKARQLAMAAAEAAAADAPSQLAGKSAHEERIASARSVYATFAQPDIASDAAIPASAPSTGAFVEATQHRHASRRIAALGGNLQGFTRQELQELRAHAGSLMLEKLTSAPPARVELATPGPACAAC